MKTEIEAAAQWIKEAQTLVIHTGAGMGKDSGLEVYRGEKGQWGEIEGESGKSVFEIMSPSHLLENPSFGWSKHAQRWKAFLESTPHEGFQIIKNWIEKFSLDYFIQTSNVDGHFQQAGFPEEKIRELHGAMAWLQCSTPCCEDIWPMPDSPNNLIKDIDKGSFPQCPYCKAIARPNVYMFRDNTYVNKRDKEQKKRYSAFLEKNANTKIVVLEIGSGPHVQSIRKNTRALATKYNAKIIRINPNDYKIKAPHLGISAGALDALRLINSHS